MAVWRFIPLLQAPGQLQMAIDRWLLDQCDQGLHPPTLRFYCWSPAAISLGYHQRHYPRHWQTLRWQDQAVQLVRRPTGGRAVLHAGDLTYSIVLPNQTGQRRQTYAYICEFLIKGWRLLGLDLQVGTAAPSYRHQVNCFERATVADLANPDGTKFIGSAQVWRGKTVLQQGSIQLRPDLNLLQQVFEPQLPQSLSINAQLALASSMELSIETITETLVLAAASQFEVEFQYSALTPSEWAAVQNYLSNG